MSRGGKTLAEIVGGLLFLVLIVGGGGAAWFWNAFNAGGPLRDETVLVIPKGSGVGAIADLLAREGVIESPLVFKLGVKFFSDDQPLHAGEFRFPTAASPRGAMQVLIEGKSVLHRITLAEGWTVREIFDALAASPVLDGPLPPPPAEGTLLPETYFFVRGDARGALVERMKANMTETLAQLWAKRDKAIMLETPQEAVILASIVEKETGLRDERARVAAVFHNRLKKGMALQSDPTVIFAVTLGKAPLGRDLTYSDLKRDSPYNTYVVTGLPPSPIANPGSAALKAVLNPAKTKELYFVADGTGGHAFAETLDGHNKNVAKWRKIQKQNKQAN
ncbi:endolytic transglycosylase MltG [Dongia sp.]|uniref:endolytic transglycosylase MltG n=1 Tax=Dongia sp. TaxID=1977262 RepID=UPI0035B4B118